MEKNVCRACLLEKKMSELFDWYMVLDKANGHLTYQECFQICTQVDVKKADAKSSYVKNMHFLCQDCVQELKTSYRFLRRAQKSAQKLHSLSQSNDSLTGTIVDFEYINIRELCKNNDLEKTTFIGTGSSFKVEKELSNSDNQYSKNGDQQGDRGCNDSSPLKNYLLPLQKSTHQKEHRLIASSHQEVTLSKIDEELNISESKKPTLEQVENERDEAFIAISNYLEAKETSIVDCRKSTRHRIRKQNSAQEKKNRRVGVTKGKGDNSGIEVKEIPCEYCNKVFPENKLRQHKSRYHRPKIFLCDMCPSSFSIANNLRRHQLTHDLNRQRNFSCTDCGRKFFTEEVYRTHIKTHQLPRPAQFHCTQCDKVFMHKGSLTLHIQKHNGPKNECSVCMKRYVRKVDLEVHMRNHSGHLPYPCSVCEKAFMTTSSLRKHELLHNGIRYKCDICNKEYSHPSKLSRHRLHHTGLPFKCAICDRGFAEPNKIRRHVRCVHKVEDTSQINKLLIKITKKNESPIKDTINVHSN